MVLFKELAGVKNYSHLANSLFHSIVNLSTYPCYAFTTFKQSPFRPLDSPVEIEVHERILVCINKVFLNL